MVWWTNFRNYSIICRIRKATTYVIRERQHLRLVRYMWWSVIQICECSALLHSWSYCSWDFLLWFSFHGRRHISKCSYFVRFNWQKIFIHMKNNIHWGCIFWEKIIWHFLSQFIRLFIQFFKTDVNKSFSNWIFLKRH